MEMSPVYSGASPDEVWPLIRDYHYAQKMPSNLQTKEYIFAVRQPGGLLGDNGDVLAAAIFGFPAGGRWQRHVLELQRLVRTPEYNGALSQLVSHSVKWLRARTGAPFVVSYADPEEGHHGGVYQACGWHYVGQSKEKRRGFLTDTGEFLHRTSARKLVSGAKSDRDIIAARPEWRLLKGEPKHLYFAPLRMRLKPILRRQQWRIQPYPKPDNAARPDDAPVPTGVSQVQPLGAAP
jgi:hypothetical protein